MPSSDKLSARAIQGMLKTRFIGKKIDVLDTVGSTNLYIKQKALSGAPEGYAVIAEHQTDGRGRLGRRFVSPAGQGVYMSVLLKSRTRMEDTQFLTIALAVAVSRAIDGVCGLKTTVKWVNDVYCNGKKICGILAESSVPAQTNDTQANDPAAFSDHTALDAACFICAGVGVNTGDVPAELKNTATSVYEETGARCDRNALAAAILNETEAVCLGIGEKEIKRAILNEYASKLFILGNIVTVTQHTGECFSAVVAGVGESGALIVTKAGGETVSVRSGEVSWRKDA